MRHSRLEPPKPAPDGQVRRQVTPPPSQAAPEGAEGQAQATETAKPGGRLGARLRRAALLGHRPAQPESLQRKVGFEFEIGVPVRGRDGSRLAEKTQVGDWNGAKFVVDNSTQLDGISDKTRSAVELIRKIAREENLTVLFVEHDMEVVFGIADWITVLHYGAVLAEGTPADIRANALVQQTYLGVAK